MQIDFHHGTTYVLARLAGFKKEEAEIIAYCSQYVDDATNSGLVKFSNITGLYYRISSAHKMLDYRNFDELANHHVWIPFHFLPGNGQKPAGQDPEGSFINKLICKPNSPVAQEMVADCINQRDQPYGLHRLGITMHVYADTWAHQGFAGINHKINEAKYIKPINSETDKNINNKLSRMFGSWGNKLKSYLVGKRFPLGHGAVLSFPDRPYLEWVYTNCFEEKIIRNNPRDYMEASQNMYKAMVRYRAGNANQEVGDLPEADKKILEEMIRGVRDDEGEDRHKHWLKAIEEGKFSFGAEKIKGLS